MNRKSEISRIVSGELVMQRRRRSTFVLPSVLLLLAAIVYFGLEMGARNNWFGLPSGFFVAASSIGWMANVVVLVVVVFTSFLISQEYALGTVKSAWVRPLSRQGWFTGKLLYACGLVTLLFLMAAVVVVALALLRLGFVDLMEKDYLVHTAGSMGLRLVLTTALVLYTIWSTAIVTAALASRINHPGGAIAAVTGIGVALMALSVFPPVRPFLLTTYIGLPSEQMVAMSKGLPLPFEWGTLVWRTLAVGTTWAVVAYVAGIRIVKNRQITS